MPERLSFSEDGDSTHLRKDAEHVGEAKMSEEETVRLERGVASAKDINELLQVIRSVDVIASSSGKGINTEEMAETIRGFVDISTERMAEISKDDLANTLAYNGVTNRFGIRDKVIEFLLAKRG